MTDEYDKKAEEFLKLTNTTFKAEFLKHDKHFEDDTETRNIYKIVLTRGSRTFDFNFGQSIVCSGQWIVFTMEGKKLMHGTYAQMEKFRSKGIQVQKNKDFKEPSAYDVLSVLTKFDPGSLEDFCGNYGYSTDSRKAEKTYNAVMNEWNNLKMLFSDEELEKLREID